MLPEILTYVHTYMFANTCDTIITTFACILFAFAAFKKYNNYNNYFTNMRINTKKYSNDTIEHYKYAFGKRHDISKSIYVAGAWIHRRDLNKQMIKLKDLGFIITSNWPSFENKLNNPDDYAECSKFDIDGVVTADTILAIMTDPKYPYRGTYTEIGCAIGSGRRIIVVCDGICSHKQNNDDEDDNNKFNLTFSHYCMENVFFWDPRIEHVSTFEDAIKLLRGEKIVSPYKSFYSGSISPSLFKRTCGLECNEIDSHINE